MNIFKKQIVVLVISLLIFSGCKNEPDAAFNVSKTVAFVNDTIFFTNQSTGADHFYWNFNDSSSSNENSPCHVYKTAGEYVVTLIAFNKKGNKSESYSQIVSVGNSPGCVFTFSPQFPKPGEEVIFLANSTENTTSWFWEFGDGTTSVEKNPHHTFNNENEYLVSLTVKNLFNTYKQADSIIVTNNPPVLPLAKFSYKILPNFTVDFTDASSGEPTRWFWDFGDGKTSELKNPSHKYQNSGVYKVNLRVFNLKGSSQTSQTVNFSGIFPEAKFIYSDGIDNIVYFKDKSFGDPFYWDWDFGDGNTSTLQDPVHQYSQIATYIVSLKVTNSAGTSMITEQVTVANQHFEFLIGNYNILDEGLGVYYSYSDQITPTAKEPNKFFTSRFGNYENANVYFLTSGTTVTVPSQTLVCGSPPNQIEHTFSGTGYFKKTGDAVTIIIEYQDSSALGNNNRTATYTKIR